MISVLVAEAPEVRDRLRVLLAADPEMTIVGETSCGAEAVELTRHWSPALVLLAAELPELNGLEVTREIMARAPTAIVLLTRSGHDADPVFDAIDAGALALLPLPGPEHSGTERARFVATLKAMADVKVVRRRPVGPRSPVRALPSVVQAIGIAASTGGPGALQQVLGGLPRTFDVPVLVVQHLPAGFVSGLVSWLAGFCPLPLSVARHGAALEPGHVYVAPDERHLLVSREGRILLQNGPPIGGHRPSATPLFASLGEAWGNGVIGVMLTGMGRDGVDGLRQLRAAGGRVIAQDRATSVVYGMPGEAVQEGLVDQEVAVERVAPTLVHWIRRGH